MLNIKDTKESLEKANESTKDYGQDVLLSIHREWGYQNIQNERLLVASTNFSQAQVSIMLSMESLT